MQNRLWFEKEGIVVSDDQAECGKGWASQSSAFLLEALQESSSPYINRFLSADTIVPGYANPQNLNRYSYVLNNPLRYIDPTGHVTCGDGEAHDCNGNKQNPGEDPHSSQLPKPDPDKGGGGGGSDPKDMKTSPKGAVFIIYWEGPWKEQPYNDMGGNCTIGYGHLLLNEKCTGAIKKFYRANPLSQSGADYFLQGDIANAETDVRDSITVDLTQAQLDALVSYVFNSGGESNQPFHTKGIPELINNGNYQEAAKAIESGPITSNNLHSDTLVDRRYAEATLFLYGVYAP